MRTFILLASVVSFFGGVLCQDLNQVVPAPTTTIATPFNASQLQQVKKAEDIDIVYLVKVFGSLKITTDIANPAWIACINAFVEICQKVSVVIEVQAVAVILSEFCASLKALASVDFSLAVVGRLEGLLQDVYSKLILIQDCTEAKIITDALYDFIGLFTVAVKANLAVSLVVIVVGILSSALRICLQFNGVEFVPMLLKLCLKIVSVILFVAVYISGGVSTLVLGSLKPIFDSLNKEILAAIESVTGSGNIDSACICGLITTVVGLLGTLAQSLKLLLISAAVIGFISGFIAKLTALASSGITCVLTLLCEFVAALKQGLLDALKCGLGKSGILGSA